MTWVIVVATMLSASAPKHQGLDRPASQADLLRAFAFGSCLAKGYANTPFAEDAGRNADVYLQGGKLGLESYAVMREAIPSDLAKPSLYDGQNYTIMKCLEFYESPQLKRLARRVASTRTK